MEELFRFIQQAFVVPEQAGQIDLTTDSDFQKKLRELVQDAKPYSDVRAEAEKFLSDVFGSPDQVADAGHDAGDDNSYSDDYGESFTRVSRYVQLRGTLLAMSPPTVESVNQAIKDVLGKFPSALVGAAEFVSDKKFASDVLVAVKLITRFDNADLTATSIMRQVIAFIEDVAAGRAPTGWHPVQLAPPSRAAIAGGVATVTRDPNHMDVWWIGKDGSVQTARWTEGYGWGQPEVIAGAHASTSAGVAAVSRTPGDLQVWWIVDDGSVQTAGWTEAHGWQAPETVPGAHASKTSGLAALSRTSAHMEVWWVTDDGSLRNAWWTGADATWHANAAALAGPHSASTSTGIAVVSRSSTHMEVWWVGENGEVSGAWWVEGDQWHGPYSVAGPHSASKSSGVAAVSRTPTVMDVWWVGETGEVRDARWTKADGWQKALDVVGAHGASTSSGVAALTRSSTHMQVWWVGEKGSLRTAPWAAEGWRDPVEVAEDNSASRSTGIATLTRIPTHMEVWWVGKDAAVQDAWWLDAAPSAPTAQIHGLLERPLQVPTIYLPQPPIEARRASTPQSPGPDEGQQKLVSEHAALYQAYEALMSARPGQLEIKTIAAQDSPHVAEEPGGIAHDQDPPAGGAQEPATKVDAAATISEALTVSRATLDSLDSAVTERLSAQLGDPETAPLQDVLDVVKRRWLELSSELEPQRIPTPARVYQLGMNLFAVQEPQPGTALDAQDPVPDFSHAVTRPVGIGDLQVVRQTLIGYEPADISHIENALPGELMRRTTLREETTELIITEETETTQSQERDTQTTDRNELVSEAQKEASQQSTSTADQTSTSNYGRLVENSKTNYARGVTDRAVNTLTQTVRQQRVQREQKVFSDKALHQLDNTNGQKPIRGIYQWVDKKYQVKVLNYGKRLLYDVMVPEPAAFLVDALKTAAQPENFQLTKPAEPTIQPSDINASNYAIWAAQYGVTGSVTPPPEELVTTYAQTKSGNAGQQLDAYGNKYDSQFYGDFKITVPQGYAAIGGYIQRTNVTFKDDTTAVDRRMEFFIGEKTYVEFANANNHLNKSFQMTGETGDIPVTVSTANPVFQFNYAVGINCRRTDEAYAQWQLKTHSLIIGGYQRQRTNYLDELSKYQTALRTQMALAHGLSRDSTTEQGELKKAFIHLLIAEHFANVYYPAPNPTAFPPDPDYVKKWGAVTAFFERAFEWEHLMYLYYPYFWGRRANWGELILIQDLDPQFEAFLKAGAARIVIPVRPGFEAALAHYHETGDVWMGEDIPDMFSDLYVSIIAEIKARNAAVGDEVCVEEWEVRLPTTLVIAREDNELPTWPTVPCHPSA